MLNWDSGRARMQSLYSLEPMFALNVALVSIMWTVAQINKRIQPSGPIRPLGGQDWFAGS